MEYRKLEKLAGKQVNKNHISSNQYRWYANKRNVKIICSEKTYCTYQHNQIGNLLMYLLRIASKFLGANLPLITNLCCPSSDPLVPISASKKFITCSGCLCILEIQFKGGWINILSTGKSTSEGWHEKVSVKNKQSDAETHVLHKSIKLTKTVFFVPSLRTWGGLITVLRLSPARSGLFSRRMLNTLSRSCKEITNAKFHK